MSASRDERPAGPSSATLAWTEVRVLVPCGWEELVAQTLSELTHAGVAFGRSSLALPAPPPGRELVRGWFPSSPDDADTRRAIAARLRSLTELADDPELGALDLEFRP